MCIIDNVAGVLSLGTLFGSFGGDWADRLLEIEPAKTVFALAAFAVLVAVTAYVIGLIRSKAAQQEPTANELISKFRELHSRGELTDAEFRTIKTTLAAQLREELRDNGERG